MRMHRRHHSLVWFILIQALSPSAWLQNYFNALKVNKTDKSEVGRKIGIVIWEYNILLLGIYRANFTMNRRTKFVQKKLIRRK